MSSGFYHIQTSNSKLFPTNTPSHFHTTLPEAFDFTGYEVAAVSALCQPAIKTILNEEMELVGTEHLKTLYEEVHSKFLFNPETLPPYTNFSDNMVNLKARFAAKHNTALKLTQLYTIQSIVQEDHPLGTFRLEVQNKTYEKAFFRWTAVDREVIQDGMKTMISEEDYADLVASNNLGLVPRENIFVIPKNDSYLIPIKMIQYKGTGADRRMQIRGVEIFTYFVKQSGKRTTRKTIKPGSAYCESTKTLADYLTTAIGVPAIKVVFDEMKQVMEIQEEIKEAQSYEIHLKDFQFILGFADKPILRRSNQDPVGKWVAQMTTNMTRGITSLYCYSNVVDYMVVTDKKVPLLCEFGLPARSKYAERMDINMMNPMYVPCANGRMRNLEFQIMDDAGVEATFLTGKSSFCLHFRRMMG